MLISAGRDGQLKFHKLKYYGPKKCEIIETFEVKCPGVINSLELSSNGQMLSVVQSPENRLGRWTVQRKQKSQILIFKLF